VKVVLPTFLIPGAGKSGTTYVSHFLGQHPDVFIPVVKEPAFLSTFPGRGFYHKGMSFYKKHFRGYSGQKHIGEASTVYMYDPESPALIKENLGSPKLIFVLRHPVDRVYSNYWQEIKAGRSLPEFAEFIVSGVPRAEEMIFVSQYEEHLKRYFMYFERGDCLVLAYDELKSAPRDFFAQITRFLELAPLDEGLVMDHKVNPSARPKVRTLSRLLQNRRIVQGVKALLPACAHAPLQRTADMVKSLNRVPFTYPPMDEVSRAYLFDRLGGTIDYVINELGLVEAASWRQDKMSPSACEMTD
jgi:hypothetical protein